MAIRWKPHVSISISDSSHAGEARRVAASLATSIGLPSARAGELSIVVSELARNVVLHAGGGEIILAPWNMDKQAGVDVLALDKGPGIENIGRSMEDGYSTAGTPGNGMGAITRLSDVFEIYSRFGHGTAAFVRAMAQREGAQGTGRFGAICIPTKGESVCGDAWFCRSDVGRDTVMIADGLGHGPAANEAAEKAVAIMKKNPEATPVDFLTLAHEQLQDTRGAAVGVAELDRQRGVVQYAGVGNIAGVIVGDQSIRSMVSMNGTVGHNAERIQEFSYPCPPGSVLIMHSDGLTSRYNIEPYVGLMAHHPALIAGVLYRDCKRGRDDATIVAIRNVRDAQG